ncbi:MAG: FeoA family protein [Pseudomonadota bacterium]|nr:FeoA family protein [Pseudomonadota bacterium]
MKLKNLKPGSTAKIFGFDICNRYYKQKLLAMGLVPGKEVVVAKYSSVSDLIEIVVDNFSLILRKSEAEIVQIEEACM